MKKLFLIIAVLAAIAANAQNSGLVFNYQAVVSNSEGVLLPDTLVSLRVSLYPGQYASTPTWVETHSVRTDFTGSFGITIGQGERDASSLVETIDDINFAAIFYWMKIEILESNTYHLVSYSQIPIAPVAKYALNAKEPAGVIKMFAGSIDKIPEGYLLCNGAEISRTDYPDLFDAIGVNAGNGDGSTTFNLPDFRGMFPRGVSGDSGNDPNANERYNEFGGNQGNDVITYQDHAIPNVQGTVSGVESHGMVATGPFRLTEERGIGTGKSDWDNYIVEFNLANVFDQRNLSIEARPKNVSVYFIIKY